MKPTLTVAMKCRDSSLLIDDIRHYQRIPKILHETHRIMQTITMTLAAYHIKIS